MAVQTDFMVAVNQIAAERGIDPNIVVESIKEAIKTGFRKDNEEEEGTAIEVEIDPQVGSIAVYADKKVVKDVTNDATQISVADAKKIESKLREGDHIQVDITPEGDFGRVAAQAAKQVILQKIREAEKEAQLKEFEDRIGEVESAVVQRMDGDSVVWEISRATALMRPEDRVPTEFYRSGSRHKVLLKAIEQGPRGKNLLVSRASGDFLKALFELEIPELVSGSIEIKAIAREAGSRSKVAVSSNVEGVDPIGSCVGQKGVRINAIMNELKMGEREEKVDIILWDAGTAEFIANALSPAQAISVEIMDNDRRVARVIVPDEQLSLAIGKDGQNVRLAAKLTGWKIDIQGETVKVETKFDEDEEVVSGEQSVVSKADDEKPKAKTKSKAKAKTAEKKPAKGKTEKPKAKKVGSSKAKDSKAVKATGLEALGLSARTSKVLEKAGIKTVAQLKKFKVKTEITGIGPKAAEEIEAALK